MNKQQQQQQKTLQKQLFFRESVFTCQSVVLFCFPSLYFNSFQTTKKLLPSPFTLKVAFLNVVWIIEN
jgi:hypothetical protein